MTTTTLPPKPKVSKKLKYIVLGGAGAGKTSILRRYFHGTFDPTRVPTLGSDFYTQKLGYPLSDGDDQQQDTNTAPKGVLSIQVWDTPGRERYAANRKPMYTAAFSDNFFKNADAALLVYDMTSSTSFTHVLKWHADLMERIRRLEAIGERTRPFPVLVVANKIDILKQRDTGTSREQATVPQREVMGMFSHAFRGKDSRYEYSAAATTAESISEPNKSPVRNRFEFSTYMGTGEKTNYLEAVLNNDEMKGSYLESLLSTEDISHPDKDMVLLWCMRNGLEHMEVSAMDGTGISELLSEMIRIGIDSSQHTLLPKVENTQAQKSQEKEEEKVASETRLLKRNDELDLHRRYAPKARHWCILPPFRKCCRP